MHLYLVIHSFYSDGKNTLWPRIGYNIAFIDIPHLVQIYICKILDTWVNSHVEFQIF